MGACFFDIVSAAGPVSVLLCPRILKTKFIRIVSTQTHPSSFPVAG